MTGSSNPFALPIGHNGKTESPMDAFAMKSLIIEMVALTLFTGGVMRALYAEEVLNDSAAACWRIEDPASAVPAAQPLVQRAVDFKHYIDDFNNNDNELYKGRFPNALAWDFLKDNIPLLDCPDEDIKRTYYFRWWTYRKHIKQTPVGFIVDEFLPNVGWAGEFNSINCAAGHHIYEGRWLRDPRYLDDYTKFWFGKGGNPRSYSFWAADSVWQRYCVSGDRGLAMRLLPDLIANYEAWEKSNRDANGLYWQIDDRDGMEVSIGGSGYRATLNSYQYGDALAIARIAELAGKSDIGSDFRQKAAAIKKLVQEQLWDARRGVFQGAAARRQQVTCKCAANCTVSRLGILICPTRNSPWRGNRPWIREVSSRLSG